MRYWLPSPGGPIGARRRGILRHNLSPRCRFRNGQCPQAGEETGPKHRFPANRSPLVMARTRTDDRAAMPLITVPGLRASLEKDQRLIGVDPGSKTIGLALSDVSLMLASPFGSLKRGKLKTNATEILAIARREGAGGLVVGLPLSMDGTAGPAAQGARDWALALSEATGLPTALFDERLSSAAANRFLIVEADVSRRKRASAVDRLAASWMLQAALDFSRVTGP